MFYGREDRMDQLNALLRARNLFLDRLSLFGNRSFYVEM